MDSAKCRFKQHFWPRVYCGAPHVHKHGGDSLMGRYFLYRMHPLSVAELLRTEFSEKLHSKPQRVDKQAFEQLLQFGGFPEPFLRSSKRFSNRWQRLRFDQLFKEDMRELSKSIDVLRVQALSEVVSKSAGQPVNMSTLSNLIDVSVDTIRRWLGILELLHFSFAIRPWFKNVPKSIRLRQKIYLWDWSLHKEAGTRNENFVASHLLKAVHWWTDIGLGDFGLFYLRDKLHREVDFLVTKNEEPWILIEVKSSSAKSVSKSLHYYHQKLEVPHAFQVAFDSPYVDVDCFAATTPKIVPVSTFLSQLV